MNIGWDCTNEGLETKARECAGKMHEAQRKHDQGRVNFYSELKGKLRAMHTIPGQFDRVFAEAYTDAYEAGFEPFR